MCRALTHQFGWFDHMEHSLTTPSQGSLGWFDHMEHSLTTPSQGSSGWFDHIEHSYTFTGQFGVVQSHGTFLNYTFTGQFRVVRSHGTFLNYTFTGGTWCVGHLPLLDETLCTINLRCDTVPSCSASHLPTKVLVVTRYQGKRNPAWC